MARMTENDVGIAVLQILAEQPAGEASLDVLKVELSKRLTISAEDSATREFCCRRKYACPGSRCAKAMPCDGSRTGVNI